MYKFIKKILKWRRGIIVNNTGEMTPIKKRALFFAINDYKGPDHDLNGCINDQTDFIKELNKFFPGFDIRAYQDSEVTIKRFTDEVTKAISVLRDGDTLLVHYSGHGTQVVDRHGDEGDGYDEGLYLYDGVVIDDDIRKPLESIPDGAVVVLMLDSCFSGTITRSLIDHPHMLKNRFYPSAPTKRKKLKKIVRIPKSEMKWIVFSGCGENQTSADAYMGGKYNGAFTFYALLTLDPGITYDEWISRIKEYLPSKKFDQAPTLEGKESLFGKEVFN